MSNRNGNRNGNRNNGADIDIDIEDGVYLDDDDGANANANANANTKTNTDMVNDDEDEDDGLMLSNTRQRRRKLGSRRGYYESVTTNRANNSPTRTRTRTATICRRCCWIGSCFVSTMCQTVVIVTAMILVGTAGFLAGSAQPDLLIVALNATTGFDLTTLASKVGDIDGISISTSVGNSNGNGTGLDDVVKDLVKASASTSASMAREKAFKVRYDPSSVLANKGGDEWENPFNLPPKNGNGNSNGNSNSVFLTPPHPFSTATHGAEDQTQTQIPAPVGFLKSPHLAGDCLVFLSEGDAYVTTIAASGDSNSDSDSDSDNDKSTIMPMSMSMPAARVTTTIGNVIDPKWHPTLPLLAYTATYSGRRDVYLMDLSASSSSSTARSRSRSRPRSPMRLTYWDVGAGGVSGVVGWIKTNVNDNDAAPHEHANALVIRALSNDASLPDYRLYVIHLSNTNSTDAAADDDTDTDADTHTDASSAAVLQVEPVPLAQAMEAAWFDNCWYFVRVKQSSHTIRYVGGTAENLWKYCGGSGLEEEDQEASTSSSSSPLFRDDEYRGTSKSPQLYHHSIDGDGNGNGNEDTHFLFFLSDRGRNPDATGKGTGTGTPWVPDRMNVWALPLYQSQKERTGRASYSTDDLIQITDTACDFEGRTIQEFSIDQTTGNLVARIGADLYFMPRASVRAKIDAASQRKSYRYRYRYSRALQEQDEEAEQHKPIENELTETQEEEENPLKEEMEEGVVGDVDSHYEVEVEVEADNDENDDVMRLTGDQDEDYGMNSTSMTAQTMQFGNSADDEVSGPASAASQTSEEDVPTESGDSGNAADAAMETIAPSSSTPPLSKAQAQAQTQAETQAQAETGKEETNTSNHILDSDNSNIRDNTGKKTEEKETNNNSDVDTTSEDQDQDQDTNSTKPPSKYYYNFESPELVTRSAESDGAESGTTDHYSGTSTELKRLPIVVYSDFSHDQERLIPLEMASHYRFGDVYETLTGSTQMLLTLRGQLWVAPVGDDDIPKYVEAGKNLPARRYRVAPGATMGGATRVLAAIHVPNPVEDDKSDRRLAVILATDPLTPTAEHAFYLVETQPGATPLFVDMNQLPKPFLGGMVSGGSTRDGGLGSVKTDTLAMSPCGNRMAWSDTDGRIVVMNMPQYQQVKVDDDNDNDDDDDDDDEQKVKFVVLPKQNELGEPMIGDEVQLSFSPGGRYLAINHHAKNRFQIISIADLGDPLGEENKIADIDLGRIRIVQATPSKFNSVSPYWGKTPTDIHDFAQNKTMAKLFGVDEPDDVATALYFLSDRDVKTDVTSPWGYRQRMPHFVDSYAVYVLPLLATGAEDPPKGQFRGGGAEELQVDSLLERMDLLKALLEEKTKTATSTQTQARQRQRRELAGSLHPLAGAFGFAERSFRTRHRRRELVGEENEATPSNTADSDDTDGDGDGDGDDYLEEAEFDKDMDIDFGPVDLTFARTAYRLSSIPAGDYDMLVCQNPSGDILLVEDSNLVIFQSDGFPSDQYEKKTFAATSRTLGSVGMSSNRKFIILVYAPDGAIRVVPNTATGTTALQSDLVLDDSVVDADGMHLSIWPTLEYRQLYDDAWRMLRDYFYDPDMTGIDWPGIHERYLPLVERCSKREELDDVLVQMSSELSALHVFVYGGEYNLPTHGDKDLEYVNEVGSLGAILKRTPAWKGYTVMNIPEPDPDFTKIDQYTTIYSPLSEQSLRLSGQRGLQVGDVIVGVNGESVMSVPDIHMLLRGTAGRSMRLDVLRLASGPSDGNDDGDGGSEAPAAKNQSKEEQVQVEASVESIITVPLSPDGNANLLYHAWEWKTEQLAEKLAKEAGISVGYVHLKDMSGASAEDAFARGFFPNYHKQGFILDVRHNRGGSIDSWVLDVLQRKAWMYWQSRDFSPETGGLGWDEHYAFRGHLIVLVDEKTSSDGEGVSRGISELGLGKIIGTRTWGGGIWLASDNHLVDGGIATAPEVGDYNDNFGWGMGIEQMGLESDIVVDNDPHETYRGKDRQLERAIEVLKLWIEEEPIAIPKPKTKRKDMTMGERECKAR